jgi:hypothetical protein
LGLFLAPLLDSPFYFSSTQATGADFNGFVGPVDLSPQFPDVRQPRALGFDIGMADAESGLPSFTAYFTTKGQFIHLQQGILCPACFLVYHRPPLTARLLYNISLTPSK